MTRYGAWILTAGLLLGSVAASAEPPAAGEETKDKAPPKLSDADRAGALADCLRQIREAKDSSEAVAVYARACSLAPQDPAVRDAQMRRMLQLGKPDLALYPARALERLQPENVLGRAVIGYWHCTHKDWEKAAEQTVLALAGMDKDPGVLNNAGQLAAWAEGHTPPVKFSTRAAAVLSEKRQALMGESKFAEGFQKITAFFEKQKETTREFDEKIAKADDELQKMRTELKAIDTRIAKLKDQVRDHKREMYSLKRSLPNPGDRNNPNTQSISRAEEQRIWDRIHDEERAIDRIEEQIKTEFRNGQPKLKAYADKKAELAKLQKDKAEAMKGIEKLFQWEAPGVDGVVTPAGTPGVSEAPKEPPAQAGTKTGGDADAQRLLKKAKMYLSAGKTTDALTLLQKILADYPGTDVAKEALAVVQKIAEQ